MAKHHPRHAAPLRQTRTRTRQNKGAVLASDPIQNTQQLNEQLRALGLYPAPTLGDGNCLFRALSDQFHGSPSLHLKLREEICDWMETHKSRYAPFVDDERGLDVHLRCMRQPGTYGGHLELTAFSHLKRRDVKVIQPGLVYVIEWTSGADLSPKMPEVPLSEQIPLTPASPLKGRDARRVRREKKQQLKDKHTSRKTLEQDDSGDDDDDTSLGAVYVAYHDWEHFSSVRNLTGPHTGIPYVVEKPATTAQVGRQASSAKPRGKPISPQSSQSSIESSPMEDDGEEIDEASASDSPSAVPLPVSRSPSPLPSSDASASASSSLSVPLVPGYNCLYETGQTVKQSLRVNLSPKRAYDGSDEAAEDSQGEAKRSRRNSQNLDFNRPRVKTKMDAEIDPDADTPELLSSAESSSAFSSPAATPPPSTVVVHPSVTSSKPLTKRQRKALGVPKARTANGHFASTSAKGGNKSAGKIVVPGGKFRKPMSISTAPISEPGSSEAWIQNGRGRVDVRGFKELKI